MFAMGLNSDDSLWFWGDSANVGFGGGVAMNRAAWNYAVITYNGTTVSMSVNGGTPLTGTPSLNSGAASIQVGVTQVGTYYDGLVDEVRVSNVVRPSGWILADYNSQKPGSTFLTVGGEN
jgi:hypothetical protein